MSKTIIADEVKTAQSAVSRKNTTARILDALSNRIRSGEWSAGVKLPSEPALAAEFAASRGSVRNALTAMETSGLVIRRHGAGTFVNTSRQLLNNLNLNTSADQMITSTGKEAGTLCLTWRRMTADDDVATRLQLSTGSEVYELYRVRTADGVPVTVSWDYLSVDLVPDQPALLGPSLYSFLATACGVEVAYGVAEIAPAVADQPLAEALNVEQGELCLLIRQVDFDANEHPLSYSVEYHLASAFKFELIRRGQGGSPAAG